MELDLDDWKVKIFELITMNGVGDVESRIEHSQISSSGAIHEFLSS